MRLQDFYSVKAAAKKAGIPYMTLHQRIHRGSVPVTRLSDTIILIHKDDIKNLEPVRSRLDLPWNEKDPTRKTDHPLYPTYHNMLRRCYLPRCRQYKNYGGRGIKVCDRWLNSFQSFVEDMGRKPSPNHSIDRYPNNDGDYEPGNCRWATSDQQNSNRRGRAK